MAVASSPRAKKNSRIHCTGHAAHGPLLLITNFNSLSFSPARIFTSLRHRRGFGVHSPFAFRFITETLRCRWDYYAYSKLKNGRERLIFRVMAFLDCRLTALGEEAPRLMQIHSLAVGASPRKPGYMLAVGHNTSDEELAEIQRLMPHAAGLICFKCGLACSLLKNMTNGMSFENLHGLTVYVSSPSLPRQHYFVSF